MIVNAVFYILKDGISNKGKYMKIIVGLGNPDKKYQNTFHNLGFMVVDKLAENLGLSFNKEKFKGMLSETLINGEKVVLVKPLTYMNLSGDCVREVVDFYKADLKDLLVVYDDFDLPKGELRIRESGSAGTHNGMKSIIANLGKTCFPRVRVGFKPTDNLRIPLIDLVLSGIKKEDKEIFDKAIEQGANACKDFAYGKDIQAVMREHNKKA